MARYCRKFGSTLQLLHRFSCVCLEFVPSSDTASLVSLQQHIRDTALQTIMAQSKTSDSNDVTATAPQKTMTQEGNTESVPSHHKEVGSLASDIIPYILNIYGMSATKKDFEIYAPNATFEDPLMCAHGVKQIKSAFYSLPKVFGEAKIVDYNVTEKETSPGNGEILIHTNQHYKIFSKSIDLNTLIKLQVEGGKVIRHEDWWDKKPPLSRNTVKVPLAGRMFEGARRVSMILTHCMMGFGKDPSS